METRHVCGGLLVLVLAGCASSSDPSGPKLAASDFVKPDRPAASAPVAAPTNPTSAATTPAAKPATKPVAAPVVKTPEVEPARPAPTMAEVDVQPGSPVATGDAAATGTAILVDAKIGDVNNRAVYASGFLEPMEAALRAKAIELLRSARGDGQAARMAWNQFAAEQIGGALGRFIRDEIFRAEGVSSLKPEQRAGLQFFMQRMRDDEIRRNQGSAELTEQEISRLTGGKDLDTYLREREQIELIRFQLYQQIDRKIQVAWRDIKQQYNRDFDKYNPDPVAYVRVIVVSNNDAEGLKQIETDLAAGKDFAEVAAHPSNLFNRDKGGLQMTQYEGELEKATLIGFKDVNDVVTKMTEGQMQGPVANGTSTKAWVKLDRIERKSTSLYDAQLGIENELFTQRQDRAINAYLTKLQGRASLTDIDEMGARVMEFARERCLEPVLKAAGAQASNATPGATPASTPATPN